MWTADTAENFISEAPRHLRGDESWCKEDGADGSERARNGLGEGVNETTKESHAYSMPNGSLSYFRPPLERVEGEPCTLFIIALSSSSRFCQRFSASSLPLKLDNRLWMSPTAHSSWVHRRSKRPKKATDVAIVTIRERKKQARYRKRTSGMRV